MDKYETIANLIIDVSEAYRRRYSETTKDNIFHPLKQYTKLNKNILVKKLIKIDSYEKLESIKIENLYIAWILDEHVFKENYDIYDIFEYLYIPDILLKENKLAYYLISYRLLSYIENNYFDTFKKNWLDTYNQYLDEYDKIINFINDFEENLPIVDKAKYNIELKTMIRLLVIIYYASYGKDLNGIIDILTEYMKDYTDEMKLHGINSWYFHTDHDKYVLFLEHYLNNSLKNKKVIK